MLYAPVILSFIMRAKIIQKKSVLYAPKQVWLTIKFRDTRADVMLTFKSRKRLKQRNRHFEKVLFLYTFNQPYFETNFI